MATGDEALSQNTTGSFNIALGIIAGDNLTTGDNNIDIGNEGIAAEANTIRIGTGQSATYIAGINGATASGGAAVFVNSDGKLGTIQSSARFKDEIKPPGKASEAVLALQPVTFRYKHEIDPDGIPQFGLMAEEVEKVNPQLVIRDEDGKPTTVRYEAVNAMLLNEFLKEHRRVEEEQAAIVQMKSTVAKQEALIARQQKQIEALTAGLRKGERPHGSAQTCARTGRHGDQDGQAKQAHSGLVNGDRSCFNMRDWPVAQRLEQGTHNPLVPGSNPGGPSLRFGAERKREGCHAVTK
jgi:hypothetical protein